MSGKEKKEGRTVLPSDINLFSRLRYCFAISKMLIESDDCLDAFVEVVEAVVLVG